MTEWPGRQNYPVCVRARMSEQERKGQQYAWGTGRGQVTSIMLQVKIQLSWIHYVSSHPLKKGQGFHKKIAFWCNYMKTVLTQILQYGTKFGWTAINKKVNRNYSVANLFPTIQTQSSFNVQMKRAWASLDTFHHCWDLHAFQYHRRQRCRCIMAEAVKNATCKHKYKEREISLCIGYLTKWNHQRWSFSSTEINSKASTLPKTSHMANRADGLC